MRFQNRTLHLNPLHELLNHLVILWQFGRAVEYIEGIGHLRNFEPFPCRLSSLDSVRSDDFGPTLARRF